MVIKNPVSDKILRLFDLNRKDMKWHFQKTRERLVACPF